jgi:hypothetical protein
MTGRYLLTVSSPGRQVIVVRAMLVTLAFVGVGAAADRSQWVWSKSWTVLQVQKRFPGATVTCSPVGPGTRQKGYNAYTEFACGVVLAHGAPYVLVIKPRSRAAWTTLSIRKTALPTTSAVAAGAASDAKRTYGGAARVHAIASESLDGSQVVLDDGSRWLVSPVGAYTTVLWHVADRITVLTGNFPGYPYQLLNARDGSSAPARFLGSSSSS